MLIWSLDEVDVEVQPQEGCDLSVFPLSDYQVSICDFDNNAVSVQTPETCEINIYLPGPPGPQGPIGPQGPKGSASPQLELHLVWTQISPSYYKHFIYTAGTLTGINVYTDNTMTVQLFSRVFSYTLGSLTQIVTTRISDSATETKNFGYVSGTLDNIQTLQA